MLSLYSSYRFLVEYNVITNHLTKTMSNNGVWNSLYLGFTDWGGTEYLYYELQDTTNGHSKSS